MTPTAPPEPPAVAPAPNPIAALGRDTRRSLNQLLRQGQPFTEIVTWLAAQGLPAVSDDALRHWQAGGYQDWLRAQERLERMTARQEFALEVCRQCPGSETREAILKLATSQLYALLEDFDPASLKSALNDDPALYARVLAVVARIAQQALSHEQHQREVERQLADARKAAGTGGIRPETIARIERELRLV